jgi:hypothetical protein
MESVQFFKWFWVIKPVLTGAGCSSKTMMAFGKTGRAKFCCKQFAFSFSYWCLACIIQFNFRLPQLMIQFLQLKPTGLPGLWLYFYFWPHEKRIYESKNLQCYFSSRFFSGM